MNIDASPTLAVTASAVMSHAGQISRPLRDRIVRLLSRDLPVALANPRIQRVELVAHALDQSTQGGRQGGVEFPLDQQRTQMPGAGSTIRPNSASSPRTRFRSAVRS